MALSNRDSVVENGDPSPSTQPKALIFDLMGTCLDWHSSISQAIDSVAEHIHDRDLEYILPTTQETSRLAFAWRQGFFDEIRADFEAGEEPEDIDETHRRVFNRLLAEPEWVRYAPFTMWYREKCVQAWHTQQAWPDVQAALPRLAESADVVVLANGTMRFQLDLAYSSGLKFDALLSSELLGMIKPDPEIYKKAISLLKYKPEECMMVAAHAYDLRAAKRVGMRTAYLQRWTEDQHEDMEAVKAEVDNFIDCRRATAEAGGLLDLHALIFEESVACDGDVDVEGDGGN